ncbi:MULTISPECIES: hypothetical protein [unclassified Neisseria]|uniref:hypothetical protein n=1 Tax=unclassified Neisseria TaxID=2623750 RepID=UPI001071E188|nr:MULTISPECIES: hypothetical protein [unclassified Neisseria]MBF0803317.1 hypothetical protein [Neisseria sp. 19428wB4_WF04]TFU43988.1 hypothetical protein E4T99_02945 [Neisseria sp. WF04]
MSKRLNWEKRTIRNGVFEFLGNTYCLTGYPGQEDEGMEILVAKNNAGKVVVKAPLKKGI